jgi:hypothetical protein
LLQEYFMASRTPNSCRLLAGLTCCIFAGCGTPQTDEEEAEDTAGSGVSMGGGDKNPEWEREYEIDLSKIQGPCRPTAIERVKITFINRSKQAPGDYSQQEARLSAEEAAFVAPQPVPDGAARPIFIENDRYKSIYSLLPGQSNSLTFEATAKGVDIKAIRMTTRGPLAWRVEYNRCDDEV